VLFIRGLDPDLVKEATLRAPDWANVTTETHVEAEFEKNTLQGTRFGGTAKCDMQFGRAAEEATAPRPKEVTVPVINPKQMK
jgi:hypothetical protein